MSRSATIKDLLRKASRSLAAAEHLLAAGFTEFCVGRAYYAMFYVAEALLLTKDLSFSKHSAVIAAFGQHFVKTGQLDQSFHRQLLEAYDLRILSDYGTDHVIDERDARRVLQNSKTSYTFAARYLFPSQ